MGSTLQTFCCSDEKNEDQTNNQDSQITSANKTSNQDFIRNNKLPTNDILPLSNGISKLLEIKSIDEQKNHPFINYVLIDSLGKGEISEVYIVKNKENKNNYILKKIKRNKLTGEEEKNNNQTKDITASELYAKFDDWNKDLIKKMDSIGKKDKKLYYKYKDMQLKFTSNISPLEGIELIDIKLNSRIYEDDIFMEENFISEYLRRGESLLYNKKDNNINNNSKNVFDILHDVEKKVNFYMNEIEKIEDDEELFREVVEKVKNENKSIKYKNSKKLLEKYLQEEKEQKEKILEQRKKQKEFLEQQINENEINNIYSTDSSNVQRRTKKANSINGITTKIRRKI